MSHSFTAVVMDVLSMFYTSCELLLCSPKPETGARVVLVLWALQDVTKHIEVHIFRLAQGSGTTTFWGSGRISGLGV